MMPKSGAHQCTILSCREKSCKLHQIAMTSTTLVSTSSRTCTHSESLRLKEWTNPWKASSARCSSMISGRTKILTWTSSLSSFSLLTKVKSQLKSWDSSAVVQLHVGEVKLTDTVSGSLNRSRSRLKMKLFNKSTTASWSAVSSLLSSSAMKSSYTPWRTWLKSVEHKSTFLVHSSIP